MAALLDRALEFALTQAGRDSQFLLKPEQKEIIEALVQERCIRSFNHEITKKQE